MARAFRPYSTASARTRSKARSASPARNAGRLRNGTGPFPPIDAFQLMMQGSVYFIRPAFADFYADPADREELSQFWFNHLSSGRVKVEIGQRMRSRIAS